MAKFSTLSDNFFSQDANTWIWWSENVHVVDGQLVISSTWSSLETSATWDLIGSSVSVQVVTAGRIVVTTASSDSLMMFVDAAGLYMQVYVNGGFVDGAAITYNATTHLWWRFREADGTYYYETSPDNATWTTQYSTAATPTGSYAAAKLQLCAAGVTPVAYDNVNGVITNFTGFGDSTPTPFTYGADTTGYTLGTAFRVVAAGFSLMKGRIWLGSNEGALVQGDLTGSGPLKFCLYAANDTGPGAAGSPLFTQVELATVTLDAWNEFTLGTPYALTSGQIYYAAVYLPRGRYYYRSGEFINGRYSGPIYLLAYGEAQGTSGSVRNGCFVASTDGPPTQSSSSSWYGIDVEISDSSPSTDATITPATVAAVAAAPAPVLSVGSTSAPDTVAATAAAPAPAVSGSATHAAAAVVAVAGASVPAVSCGTAADPAAVTSVTAVPGPQVAVGAATTPAAIASVLAIPAPAVSGAATAAPVTASMVAAVPDPSVSGAATAAPAAVGVMAAVPAPAVSAGSTTDATVTPASVAATTAVPQPAVITPGGATITPMSIAAATTVPSVQVRALTTSSRGIARISVVSMPSVSA